MYKMTRWETVSRFQSRLKIRKTNSDSIQRAFNPIIRRFFRFACVYWTKDLCRVPKKKHPLLLRNVKGKTKLAVPVFKIDIPNRNGVEISIIFKKQLNLSEWADRETNWDNYDRLVLFEGGQGSAFYVEDEESVSGWNRWNCEWAFHWTRSFPCHGQVTYTEPVNAINVSNRNQKCDF